MRKRGDISRSATAGSDRQPFQRFPSRLTHPGQTPQTGAAASPFLRRLEVPKLHQQQQIVSDLQCTADEEGPSPERGSEQSACQRGTGCGGQVRGTDVKLAAAARSTSVTTAIT
jgi:hypothetical protein